MKVFEIDDVRTWVQTHAVVAETMEDAVRLWREKYKSEPRGIKIYSEYVIIDKKES